MALKELFEGEYDEFRREPILNVLDRGLLAAERGEAATWSGSDDLKVQFDNGKLEPAWLDKVNPELAAIYRSWLAENRSRVDAVLKKRGT